MTMLERIGSYEKEKSKKALDMLLRDRENEFKELAQVILHRVPGSKVPILNWEQFILCFCLDVSKAFKSWSGEIELEKNSETKALTLLRQLARDKSAMIHLTHLLNIAYDLAEEFKIIYRRLE